jgi:hypothetical protein
MAYTVQDYLVENSPQIETNINQKLMTQPTPWISLYPQEYWNDEVSNSQKTFTFDRPLLADANDFEVEWADVATDITANDNTANHQSGTGDGVPPADTVNFTQTLRSFNLQHKAIWGPTMNTNQLRDKFERAKQMNACVTSLADQSREFWIKRKRREYTRIASQKIILDSGFSLSNDRYDNLAFPEPTGTDSSILTNGFTDAIYEYLNLNGAGEMPMGRAENRPVYGLVTSSRQSRRLIMADPDTREDFRYSSQNEKLLAPLGVKWNYNGFTHIIDDKTNRWEQITASSGAAESIGAADGTTDSKIAITASGVLTMSLSTLGAGYYPVFGQGSEITLSNGNQYIITGKTSETVYACINSDGSPATNQTALYYTAWNSIPQFVVIGSGLSRKKVPNPAWLTATWEDSYIFHQGVCTSLVPKPITSVGKATFDAVDYSGSYRWTNYDDRTDNPDKTIGQFRGVLSNGTRPDNPEFGVVIRHLAVPSPAGRVNDGSTLG